MASPGAIASSLKHFCWNPRKSDFFPSFDAKIELDKNVVRPYKPITGRLKLSTSKLIRFNGGIRVQLDANVKLRFESKVDNRHNINWAVESILKDAPDLDEGNYVLSPVRIQLVGEEGDVEQPCTMEPGEYTYPFTLQMDGEALPAPFKSHFGSLQYYIAAYMGSPHCYVQVAEAHVAYAGFLDLTRIPKALEPLRITSNLHSSIFSSSPLATFTLTSERIGYNPGESIDFNLAIENPKGREIRKATVALIRRVTYTAQGASKTTIAAIDTHEDNVGSKNVDILCQGTLSIPKPCIPSYSGKAIYNVSYFLQYEVAVSGHPAMGKGQGEILIGTTKPTSALLVSRLQERRESIWNPGGKPKEAEDVPKRPRSYSICARTGPRPAVLSSGSRHFVDFLAPPTPLHSRHQRALSMTSFRDFEESLE